MWMREKHESYLHPSSRSIKVLRLSSLLTLPNNEDLESWMQNLGNKKGLWVNKKILEIRKTVLKASLSAGYSENIPCDGSFRTTCWLRETSTAPLFESLKHLEACHTFLLHLRCLTACDVGCTWGARNLVVEESMCTVGSREGSQEVMRRLSSKRNFQIKKLKLLQSTRKDGDIRPLGVGDKERRNCPSPRTALCWEDAFPCIFCCQAQGMCWEFQIMLVKAYL